jgi:hypothetical protein
MKPSSSNRQLLGLVRNTRRAHNLSGTEIGLDASHNNIRLLSERREKNFLDIPSHRTSPLIGLIELFRSVYVFAKWP